MTEGTPAPFATHSDVSDRWRPFRDTEEQNRAEVRLGDASSLLRALVPGIDERADNDPQLARAATSTVVDAVVRVLRNPDGAKQLQETIGPRAYGLTFEGRTTGVFFTEEELAPLRPSAGRTGPSYAFGTAYAQARPGWAPR